MSNEPVAWWIQLDRYGIPTENWTAGSPGDGYELVCRKSALLAARREGAAEAYEKMMKEVNQLGNGFYDRMYVCAIRDAIRTIRAIAAEQAKEG